MTLTRSDRQNLLGKITTLVSQQYYDPAFGGKNWEQIVSTHRDAIVQADTVDGFEAAVTSMLQDLNSSGMGLLGPTTKITLFTNRKACRSMSRFISRLYAPPQNSRVRNVQPISTSLAASSYPQ